MGHYYIYEINDWDSEFHQLSTQQPAKVKTAKGLVGALNLDFHPVQPSLAILALPAVVNLRFEVRKELLKTKQNLRSFCR